MDTMPHSYLPELIILILISTFFLYTSNIRRTNHEPKAEKKLQEREEQFRLITDNMQDLVSLLNPSGEIEFVSPSHQKVLGHKPSDLLGIQVFALVHSADIKRLQNDINKIIQTKETLMSIYRLRHQNGDYISLESQGTPILNQNNKIESILISSRDVSERIEKELALAQSQRKLKQLAFYDTITEIPYSFFTKEVSEKIDRTILLEDGLKTAISQIHFHLVYQPQMDIQKNQLAGLEVLLRYTHPTLGNISPVEFIPICEKIGIIDMVTEWVMREAFNQQKKWKEDGYGDIPISINISPTTLENKTFLQTVQFYLDLYGTDPATIEFELTEEAFMHDMEYVGKLLGNLSEMGIKISLDDFGAGYSSLKYLKDLPIKKVKIDRSFVTGIPDNEKEKAIIESVIELTHRLQGEVICEGVETEEQLSFLVVKGCRLVQGYFFSKPLPKDQLEKSILKRQIKHSLRAIGE